MHGLVNSAIQSFVCDAYGPDVWLRVTSHADLGFDTFENMLVYDDVLTERVLDSVFAELDRPREAVMEDIGLSLITKSDALRRLLRFSGATFLDFLYSLDDLADRTRLAVPDLAFPVLELHELGRGELLLVTRSNIEGFAHMMSGVLQGMADDYGALVTIAHRGAFMGTERLSINVHEAAFAPGRRFDLAARIRP